MAHDPGYTSAQYRMTAAHRKALGKLGREARRMGLAVEVDSPLSILEFCVRMTAGQVGVTIPPRAANAHGGPRRKAKVRQDGSREGR